MAAPAGAAQTVTSNPGAATTRTRTITRPGRTVTITRPSRTVTVSASSPPVLVTDMHKRPAGDRLTAAQVLRIASRDPRVRAELRRHPKAVPYEYTKGTGQWQVSWFSHTKPQTELLQVYVLDSTGQVSQAWTGFQVAWSMARGYPGAFGRRINAWFIWLPLCLFFVAPFLPWRRRPGLLHLDLLVLLAFSVSLAFFNHGQIGLSVPLVYPFMVYLLVRLTLLAFGRGVARRPLRTVVPVPWLWVGVIFLETFRVALNLLNSNVIDVGYSGVIGADKLIHGVALYGHWPKDNMYGDTYGPVSYFLYVPFRELFGWSGTWDNLPAAHAAAIFFDAVTAGGLFALGRRVRDARLGTVLVYAWVAYPFTLYSMNSNTNDSLVAALVVLALLAIGSAPGRGVMAALAGLTKFAPFVLAPLLLRGVGPPPRPRATIAYVIAFAVTVAVCMLPVLIHHDLHFFWRDSIQYQADRTSPFSIWGLWGGLGIEQHVLQGAVVAAGIGVYFVPAQRTLVQVAALAGALIIALQMTITYWLYPYLVWFVPMVLLAVFASQPDDRDGVQDSWERLQSAEGEPVAMRIASAPG